MKLTFSEYVHKRDYEAYNLSEKQIIYGKNEKYGQIVFLAGGAASGKGFAREKFMHGEMFKIRDVDDLKIAFQKLDKLGKFTIEDLLEKYGNNLSDEDKSFIEKEVIAKKYTLKDLNLKTPSHVYALHILVRATGAKDKTLDLILDGAKESTLPNIIFDTTFADLGDLNTYVPKLLELGYSSKNINITWILTNYEIAIKNNKLRPRVVPDDILLKTHKGAAKTIFELIKTDIAQKGVDGGVYVVLNNPQNTTYRVDSKTGKHYIDMKGRKVVDNFLYITLKKPGGAFTTDAEIKKTLYTWIKDNVPPESLDPTELDKL